MNRQILTWSILYLVAFVLIVTVTIPNKVNGDLSVEEITLKKLGLNKNVTDEEIIKLLDDPRKLIPATSLIIRRKIYSAIPKLTEMMKKEDKSISIIRKLNVAEALCSLGNKEWIEPIKKLSIGPNAPITLTDAYKVRIAGLLARAGDYSQFEIVKSCLNSNVRSTRSAAIRALGDFRDKINKVTDEAAELLETIAKNDPEPFLRDIAITSLEKIAKEKPEITSRVLSALEANRNSTDESLRIMCNAKLEMYRQIGMTDDAVIKSLDDRRQFLTAISQIEKRKMYSAVPRLVEIVRQKESSFNAKIFVVRALVSLDNREWIEPMKMLLADPNGFLTARQRILIAGLLASGGDYSQFEMLKNNIGNDDAEMRIEVMRALGDFRYKSDEFTNQAAKLLEAAAMSDSDTIVRHNAIVSLEKMAETRPEITFIIINALEANLNSPVKNFQEICNAKLSQYRQKLKKE